jgi:hypothetical protein
MNKAQPVLLVAGRVVLGLLLAIALGALEPGRLGDYMFFPALAPSLPCFTCLCWEPARALG